MTTTMSMKNEVEALLREYKDVDVIAKYIRVNC